MITNLGCNACMQSAAYGRSLRGYGDPTEDFPAAVGAQTAAGSASGQSSMVQPIVAGTITGVLVWGAARLLNRIFGE